ncbi:unnamed protein product [Vitrella brassicaformis CCMP3155]|uniref:Uncharacterized protein n=1 Tax=Vitrella brassicaformis (strain CCMP3155) TaxID=1169540 RepID=A0A0G4G6N3_VITBC|nr:unnamed protein product [Vitrella brassicaformis CCMP3155]|eukprot:CEM24023.1 unnamed protein product [Vitrella brassicaformis CCMP3155]
MSRLFCSHPLQPIVKPLKLKTDSTTTVTLSKTQKKNMKNAAKKKAKKALASQVGPVRPEIPVIEEPEFPLDLDIAAINVYETIKFKHFNMSLDEQELAATREPVLKPVYLKTDYLKTDSTVFVSSKTIRNRKSRQRRKARKAAAKSGKKSKPSLKDEFAEEPEPKTKTVAIQVCLIPALPLRPLTSIGREAAPTKTSQDNKRKKHFKSKACIHWEVSSSKTTTTGTETEKTNTLIATLCKDLSNKKTKASKNATSEDVVVDVDKVSTSQYKLDLYCPPAAFKLKFLPFTTKVSSSYTTTTTTTTTGTAATESTSTKKERNRARHQRYKASTGNFKHSLCAATHT